MLRDSRHPTLGAALILLLAASGASAQERLLKRSGVAQIFNADRAVVVWPHAAAEPERARAAAGRVAAWLQGRWGVETTLAADDELTAEQLGQHLFAIGWENNLVNGERTEPAFLRNESGFSFGGSVRGRPQDDLVFLALSPYGEQKFLGFWSSIDLERIRFAPFPAIGGDWSLVRGYLNYDQGKLQPGVWPPRIEPDFRLQSPIARLPEIHRTEHYTIHAPAGIVAPATAEAVGAAREEALARAAESLGRKIPRDLRVEVHLYDTADRKMDLTGVPDDVHFHGQSGQLHMILKLAERPNPQREIEILARTLYGPCSLTMFCEGLPLAATSDPAAADDRLGMLAASIVEADNMPDLDAVADEERLRAISASGGIAAAALWVQWLRDRAGEDRFGDFYSSGRLSTDVVAAALDVESDELRAEFDGWLTERAARSQVELDFRRVMREAETARRALNDEERADALRRAIEIKPADAGAWYRLGMALRDVGDGSESVDAFRQAIKLSRKTRESALEPYSRLEIANLLLESGDTRGARKEAQRVLRLPDRRGSHEMAEEILAEVEAEDS